MRYISGLQALSINSGNSCIGDIRFKVTATHLLGVYGVNKDIKLLGHIGVYNVANDIRAILDMINDGKFDTLMGFRLNISNIDTCIEEIFNKTYYIMKNSNKNKAIAIGNFMYSQYGETWLGYIKDNKWAYLDRIVA